MIFIPGWPNETVDEYTKRLALQTPSNSGRWKKIYATCNPKEAKYAICQDNPISIQIAMRLGFRKSQILYIKREADTAIKPIDPNLVLVAYQSSERLIPAVWWISLPFDDLKALKYPQKNKACSVIVSSCNNLPGHRKRLEFITKLSHCHDMDVDIYGRGHAKNSFNNKYKGELTEPGRCKRKGLLNYYYSVCIENTQEDGYVTEKFNDAILCYTMPIYHGAPNISTYYPGESYCELQDITKADNTDKVLNIIKEGPTSEMLNDMYEARDLLMFKYNIWNIVNALAVQANT